MNNDKKLVPIGTTQLTHPEFGQFIDRQIQETENLGKGLLTDATLNVMLSTIKTTAKEFTTAMLQAKKNPFSVKVEQQDMSRDKAISAYHAALKTASYTEVGDEKEAYHTLASLSSTFHDIARLNYEAESKEVAKYTATLESQLYKAAVTKLNLGSYVTRMKNTNESFITLFSTRNQHDNELNTDMYATKKVRNALKKQYENLANYVLSMANTFDKEPYISTLTILNTNRSYYNDIVKRREGIRKADAAKNQSSATTT